MSFHFAHNVESHVCLRPLPRLGPVAARLPLRPMPTQPTLHLLIFEKRCLPKSMSHWALFLPYQEGCPDGRIFSVRKTTHLPIRPETLFELKDFDTRNQAKMAKIPLTLFIEETKLLEACHEVIKNRSFDFWVNNCQKWVCEVVERVEDELQLETHINLPEIAQTHGYRMF